MNKRKVLKITGSFLVITALFFVSQRLWVNRALIFAWQFTPRSLLTILISAFFYACTNYSISYAWFRLLIWYGQLNINVQDCLCIYARNQIFKYIPGNLFHYAGRHLAGRDLGMNHVALVGASFSEVMGLLIASSMFSFLGIVFLNVTQKHIPSFLIMTIFIITFFSPVIFYKIASKFKTLGESYLLPKKTIDILTHLLSIYLLYYLFFLILGGLFLNVVFSAIGHLDLGQMGTIITIFSLAWIGGFITPGAPSGIGIREAIIVSSLSKFIGEPTSLYAAFMFRIITILGDLLFFLSSFFFTNKINNSLTVRLENWADKIQASDEEI